MVITTNYDQLFEMAYKEKFNLDPEVVIYNGGLVTPGRAGKIIFHITGARPTIGQMRISLGQGVSVKVSEIKDTKRTLGAIVTVMFTVDKGAKNGSRDLKVQFAKVILNAPRLLFVHSIDRNK